MEDPDAAHLHVLAKFEEEQTAAYLREDSLYGPYREGMREAAARMAVALAGERSFLESLHRQPPSTTTAEIQAANAELTEATALLRE
jgi:hypothetical protein